MFFIKELSLIHTSTSLAKGYKDIENKSNEIINNLKINNLESHIPEPSTNIGFIDKKIKIFFVKALIITISISFISCINNKNLWGYKLAIDNAQIKTGKNFGTSKENIKSLASEKNQIDDKTSQEILGSIKIIVDRYKPYIDELKSSMINHIISQSHYEVETYVSPRIHHNF